MNASTPRFTWCLLAAAVIGPLAFLGCFWESLGACPDLDHDFHGCFLGSSGMLWFDEEPENELCNLVTGGGVGLLHESSGRWGFSGDPIQKDWGMDANLTITYRRRPDDEDVVTIPSDFAVIRSDEDGGKFLRLGLSYLSTNTNLDPPSSNNIVAIQQDLPYVGEECPPITAITSWLPTVVGGWQIYPPPTEWFLQDDGPQAWVSMEAENHMVNEPRGDHAWQLSTEPPGFSADGDGINDGNMVASPNQDFAVTEDEDIEGASPRLDYHINFVQMGKYAIWLRMWAPDENSELVHLGLNGLKRTSLPASHTISDYGWYGYGPHGSFIDVDEPGIYTLNLWMGDDGVKVDKIVLTKSEEKPTGTGPAQSPVETLLDDD